MPDVMSKITLQSFVPIKRIKRVVIKIGSNILTDIDGVRIPFIRELVREVGYLADKNIQTVIVTSGAIATAMSYLKRAKKPVRIPEKQAFASIGQPILMGVYAREFKKIGRSVGQILLTHDGLENRERYLNAKHALDSLLDMDIIPIINENDSVTVDEIKIGDNDRLSAYVAALVDADLLIILSHVAGLYSANPVTNPEAELIHHVDKIDKTTLQCVFEGKSETTTGGMQTKLIAADYCMGLGLPVIITSGFEKKFAQNLLTKKISGTLFYSGQRDSSARKSWISAIRKVKGTIVVDQGAAEAVVRRKTSLLPSGIVAVEGSFSVGDCVEITDPSGKTVARGLSSYAKSEIELIMGHKSSEIQGILGFNLGNDVVHRDDMVVLE